MATQMVGAQCGNCSRPMAAGEQFCSGCGQPLWQKCPNCEASALLSQKFCNGCGLDIHAVIEKQFKGLRSIYERSLEDGKNGKFKIAIRLLKTLVDPQDYRFNEIAAQAKSALENFEQQRAHWEAQLAGLQRRVERYQAAGRVDDMLKLLATVPPGVLTEEMTQLLKNSQNSASALAVCKSELKSALAEKRYDDALGFLTQIVEQSPGAEKYQKHLDEVARKVLHKAEQLGNAGKLPKAIQLLKAIPSACQNEKYLQLLNQYQEVMFLRLLLAKATFMSPTVFSALTKLDQLTPQDPLVASLKEKARKLRKTARNRMDLWPEWMKPEKGMLGLPIVPTTIPSSFPGSRPECIEKSGHQFWIAIGLALQGLTQAMPKGDFLLSKEPPKGILSLINKKKPKVNAAWGLDIGDSGARAVLLRKSGEPASIGIENAVYIKFEKPLQSGMRSKLNLDVLKESLSNLVADQGMLDIPVVINYPGSELIARFLKLPPASGKNKYDDFVQQDGRANIPVPMDMLLTAYYISEPGEDKHLSPGATYVAGRAADIQARKSLVEEAGIKVTGIQPEAFALWNTLQFVNQIENSNANSWPESAERGKYQAEADLVLDVGDDRTNILIAHSRGIWFRTLDWGLARLTNAICSAQNLTFGEADRLRKEITRATFFHQPVGAMQNACAVPRRELERSVYVARDALGELRFRRAMLVGGGAAQPFLSSWLNGLEF